MANLLETDDWAEGIYQIEKNDPVLGGADGIMNKQAKQLGARTKYLRKRVDEAIARAIPIGAIIAYPKGKHPVSFLKCNGTVFDQTIYPDLFKYLGTNVLPNYSGDSQEKTAIGSMAYFAHEDIDDTWLVLDGGMTSKTEHAALYSMLGTRYGAHGQLPDARGLFVRSLGGAEGIDAGRVLGSVQGDAMRELSGQFSARGADSPLPADHLIYNAGGIFSITKEVSMSNGAKVANVDPQRATIVSFAASDQAPVANEIRPHNISLYLCVKAKTTASNANIEYAIKAFGSIENPSSIDLKTIQDALNRLKLSDRLDLSDSNTGATSKAVYDLNLKLAEAAAVPKVIGFKANQPLPTTDIGPIWHERYASMMQWVVYDANGASYAGYASIGIGRIPMETQPTLRMGYIRSGAAAYNKATYPALWNWAKHNGLVKSIAQWEQGTIFYRDNDDGTFTPPDVRGEFQRYWDDGRGIDLNRPFGSWQQASATGGYALGEINAAVYTSVVGYDGMTALNSGNVYIGVNKRAAVGSELHRYHLRPRSSAFLAAIKH